MADIFSSSCTKLLYMLVIQIWGSDALIPEASFYGHKKDEEIRGGGELNTDKRQGKRELHYIKENTQEGICNHLNFQKLPRLFCLEPALVEKANNKHV